jgi:trans-2,3-dihydro-3-hydroxyanthranilate isomerase
MTRRFDFRQVDVFTDRALAGNPLAVFPDATGLSDAEMQALARETNLSETTFVLLPSDAGRSTGADYRVRIFTPGEELPFAGHTSVGTAWVLAQLGRFDLAGSSVTVRQEVGVGVLPLALALSRGNVGEITLTTPPPRVLHDLVADEAAELARALEFEPSGLGWPAAAGAARPAVIWCGLPTLVVPVSSLAALAALDARVALTLTDLVRKYGVDTVALVAPGHTGPVADADAHVRVLCDPRTGIVEDPATGSAAAPVAIHIGRLAGLRVVTQRTVIEQGVEIGRPSRLFAEADFDAAGQATAARVSGRVVGIAEGWFELPDA